MKKKLLVGLALTTMLSAIPSPVMALGSASVNIKGSDTAKVGENVTVRLTIEDVINDHNGIVSVGGKLVYDEAKLELVDSKKLNTPYTFWFNPESNMFAGLDFTFENELNKDTEVYEFTFKAKDTGSAFITLEEAELADKYAEILTSNVYGKTISIKENNPEVELLVENNKKLEKANAKLEEKINSLEKMVSKLSTKTKKDETIKVEKSKETLTKINNKVCALIKLLSQIF